jgi:hypothetical protein
MAINFIDSNRIGNQDLTVAFNQGLSQTIEQVTQGADFKNLKKTERQDPISRALEAKNKGELGLDLLRDFFGHAGVLRAGFQGRRPNREAEKRAEEELKQLLGKKENFGDIVQLSRSVASGILSRLYADKNEARREIKSTADETEENTATSDSSFVRDGAGQKVTAAGKVTEHKRQGNDGSSWSDQTEEVESEGPIENLEDLKEIFKNILFRLEKNINLTEEVYKNNSEVISREGQKNPATSSEVVALLKEYAGLFMDYLISNDSQLYTKLKELEGQLRAAGVWEKEIINLQMAIRTSVRQKIASGIQKNLVGKYLTEGKAIDSSFYERAANDWIELGFYNQKLGGWDFGNYHQTLQGTADEMGHRALEEVADFLSHEFEKTLIGKVFTGADLKNDREIKDFLKLSQGTGFRPEEWLAEVWPQKRLHFGLNLVDAARLEQARHQVVAYDGDPLLYQNSFGGGDGRREEKFKRDYEVADREEKDVLIARLRALYLRRLLEPEVKTFFETLFELRKTRKGLLKLGLYTPLLDKQVKKEARLVARAKFLDELKDALLERATLYETKGTAFKSVEGRIKSVLKDCGRVGLEVTAKEFDELSDFSNRSMFEVGKQELESVYLQKQMRRDSKSLENKEKLILKLLERLSRESKINFDAPGLYRSWYDKYIEGRKVSIKGV